MNEGFQFLDIIFFAMVAAFILLRLRSVLGRRTGHERRPGDLLSRRRAEKADDNVIQLPDAEEVAAEPEDDFADVTDKALAAGLTQIKVADPGFTREGFLEGARAAFEMIVGAFAAGDVKALRSLLADEVYERFAQAIRDREQEGRELETVLVSIDDAEIVEAGMNGRLAFVTVRFATHQINVTRDADGAVVEGDPQAAVEVIDLWTFERNTRARDPNWRLVATRSPA